MYAKVLRSFFATRRFCRGPWECFKFICRMYQDPMSATPKALFELGELRFRARPKDWYAVEETLLQSEYSFIRQLLETRDIPIVLDVGANIGMFAISTFQMNARSQVVSFEPSQETFDLLSENCRLNNPLSWRVSRTALWKEDGQIKFENRGYSTSSRIATESAPSLDNEQVPCFSLGTLLDTVGGKEVDLLKLDIEGAEEAVLVGQEAKLKNVAALIVEVHPPTSSVETIVAILKRVYRHVYVIPGRKSSKPLLLGANQAMDLPEITDKGNRLETQAA